VHVDGGICGYRTSLVVQSMLLADCDVDWRQQQSPVSTLDRHFTRRLVLISFILDHRPSTRRSLRDVLTVVPSLCRLQEMNEE